jgi:hypothetical protein
MKNRLFYFMRREWVSPKGGEAMPLADPSRNFQFLEGEPTVIVLFHYFSTIDNQQLTYRISLSEWLPSLLKILRYYVNYKVGALLYTEPFLDCVDLSDD